MSKKCVHCHIKILDSKADVCPLCNGVLSEDDTDTIVEQNGYPDVVAKRREFPLCRDKRDKQGLSVVYHSGELAYVYLYRVLSVL